jgi:hypothetical protein
MEFDGASHLAECRIGESQVAEGLALIAAVAVLASDGEVLLVEFNGASRLA